jgi:simple sugar transport system substrate-binding protein
MMKPEKFSLSRRQIIRGLLATSAFAATVKFGTGCTPAQEPPPETTTGASPATPGTMAEPLVVGFIYVGSKDDFGYNQAHAEGAAAIAALPGVKLVEQASVPETTEVQEAMRSMIDQDGAKALFPTSFGYFDPHILEIAKQYGATKTAGHFNRAISIYDRNKDRTVAFSCPDCNHRWDR